jgi:hypothetical protein
MRGVVKRSSFALLGMAALLAGCKEPQAQGSGNAFVRAGDNIAVKSVKVYTDSEKSYDGDTIYLITFTFTNQVAAVLVPRIVKFQFEDEQKVRHAALDGGAAVLAGINNDLSAMQRGDSRDFTLGFRVFQGMTGSLFYDPT